MGIWLQRIHMVIMLQSHPTMIKQNVLGNYFSQIFTKETKDIYDTSKIINRQSSPNPVNFYFDTDNILDKLTRLNIYKSPSPDGFHPRVSFEIKHEIVVPLQILYTASFLLENYRQTGNLQILRLYIKR